jgi:hypothetical protein
VIDAVRHAVSKGLGVRRGSAVVIRDWRGTKTLEVGRAAVTITISSTLDI